MGRVLIDGYNLLSATDFRDREQLIWTLSRYQKNKGHSITIVFDGTHHGTFMGDRYQEAGIDIIFSPVDVTADDVLEEILEKPNAASWIVVSSDRRVQSAATKAHASYVTTQEFIQKLRTVPISAPIIPKEPWMEGREEEWISDQTKTGNPRKKLSKKELQRKRRSKKL